MMQTGANQRFIQGKVIIVLMMSVLSLFHVYRKVLVFAQDVLEMKILPTK